MAKKDKYAAAIKAELKKMKNGEVVKLTCERCQDTLGYGELPEACAAYCEHCLESLARDRVVTRDIG